MKHIIAVMLIFLIFVGYGHASVFDSKFIGRTYPPQYGVNMETNLKIGIHDKARLVLYESSASSTIITISKYSIFFVAAGLVTTGVIIERDKLVEYFLPVMTLSLGFMLGQKF